MRRLLVFLKYPTPGKVKTRLAISMGAEAASEAYRMCAEQTLERLRTWHTQSVVFVDPPGALASVRDWLGPIWRLTPQQGDTLGDRLEHATSSAFGEGARQVVAIGTDSPWLTPEEIEQAFTALEHADVALGPSEDGGYYLIGLSRPAPALFDGIAWSTAAVFQQTLTRASALGLRVHTLRVGYDVDRPEDWQRFLALTQQVR